MQLPGPLEVIQVAKTTTSSRTWQGLEQGPLDAYTN